MSLPTREELAKLIWQAASNSAIWPGRALTAEEWEPIWRNRLTPSERDRWFVMADAILALVRLRLGWVGQGTGDPVDDMAHEISRLRDDVRALAEVLEQIVQKDVGGPYTLISVSILKAAQTALARLREVE